MGDIHGKGGKMEGWLFLNKSSGFGMHTIHKMYFVLEDFYLKSFMSIPIFDNEIPVGNAIIDSCIRVIDNGKRKINNKAIFFFTIYLASNHKQKIKLGAMSEEEAGKWIHSLKNSTMKKQCPHNGKNIAHFFHKKWKSIKMDQPMTTKLSGSIDRTPCSSSTHMVAFASHIKTPSSWKIISCVNGLRIFREASGGIHKHVLYSGRPAIMAIGTVDGTPEAVFQTLMSLGSSRSEWDFCFYKGTVIEHLDDHIDIIHNQLDKEWLPWGMQSRDLLLRRCWGKEDDGTYVVLLNSVIHKKCPLQSNCIRASLKSGGYIITPTNQGKQSVVRHMLAIDWKSWRSQLLSSMDRSITIRMLERVAALREVFKEKSWSIGNDSYGEFIREIKLPEVQTQNSYNNEVDVPIHVQTRDQNNAIRDEAERALATAYPTNREDESDKFFDVPEPITLDSFENELSSKSPRSDYVEFLQPRIPGGGTMELQNPSAQKRKLQEGVRVEDISCKYGFTLPMDPTSKLSCSCTISEPSLFSIRGKNYLRNQQKVKAEETMMQLVGADWLKSDKREDDLAQRLGGIVQKYAAHGRSEFFIVINMQVPGAMTYNLALYYMTRTPLEENYLLERFVDGDDAFRNSRFKLIPYISKGSWIVKQSVRRKPCLLGKALDIKYSRGKNYLELNVDVGSSKVARRVVNLVLGYVNNLVIEMAFLIQASTEEELPECLLGTCRLNLVDTAKAFSLSP